MLEAGIGKKLSNRKLLETGQGKIIPSIFNALTKPTDKAAYSNATVDSMIRKIEAEYIAILTPFDSLISKIDLEINEIKSRILHCKEKHLIEEEIGFYNILNQFIKTQVDILTKKLDTIDKKNKAVQAEKKLAIDKDKNKGGDETTSDTLNPSSSVSVYKTLGGNQSVGVQKVTGSIVSDNAPKSESSVPGSIQQILERNRVRKEVGDSQEEVQIKEEPIEEKEEVVEEHISMLGAESNHIEDEVLQIYNHRVENEEEIFNTPNDLKQNYNDALNALSAKNMQSKTIFYLDINSGKFWFRIFGHKDGEWQEIKGSLPGIAAVGNVRIDVSRMEVTTQLGHRYELVVADEDDMTDFYAARWDSGSYDIYLIPPSELAILKQKIK